MVGLTTLALFIMHGALYLTMKTEGRLFVKIALLLRRSIIFFVAAFGITTVYTLVFIPHLSDRFRELPWLVILPVIAILAIANVPRLVSRHRYRQAFLFSALTISMLLMLVAVELYPTLIMSTLDTQYSITIYNAAASEKSLKIMLGFAAVGTPLVGAYTLFVFWTFRGKVRLDETSY